MERRRAVGDATHGWWWQALGVRGCHLRVVLCAQVRRPNNYDVNVAVMLGPTEPDPTMDLSQLDIVKTVVQDSPHKLFIGGLPCDWNEDQVGRCGCRPRTLHGCCNAAAALPDRTVQQGAVLLVCYQLCQDRAGQCVELLSPREASPHRK